MRSGLPRLDKNLTTIVCLTGLVCLMVELIQIRMLTFFLGFVSNFLAIPIALLGLALGSLYYHYFHKGDAQRLISFCATIVFPLLVIVFAAFFVIANAFYFKLHIVKQTPAYNLGRLFAYSGLFLLPYMVFGTLFAAIFSIGAQRIGRLYFYDLVGAALGCVLTPILFTYLDLPLVITCMLMISLGLSVYAAFDRWRSVALGMSAVFVLVAALAYANVIFKEHPHPGSLIRNTRDQVTEVVSRWNELTRTALLRTQNRHDSKKVEFFIVQNAGLGHVTVDPYVPGITKEEALGIKHAHATAYRTLGYEPKEILVMFAGTGRDMIFFDGMTEGKARITGVELNRVIKEFTEHPLLRDKNLAAFYKKDNINFVIEEGRDFLNRDNTKYDIIFVSRSGSIYAHRTGNTGRFLATHEAMASYLDHLTDRGVIYIWNQPADKSAMSFKKLFAQRNLGPIENALYAFTYFSANSRVHNLIVKPSGLTQAHIEELERALPKGANTTWARNGKKAKHFEQAMETPVEEIEDVVMTDDRPFFYKIDLANFTLFPKKKDLKHLQYATNWIQVFTVVLFAVICLAVIAVVSSAGTRKRRLPFLWIMYFLISGIGYMSVEISLIGKIELFMGNPLYAVAVILAVFLASNGLGAFLQDRFSIMKGSKTLIGITALCVAWGIASVELCTGHLLSLPIALKIPCAVLCVFPAGTSLGMYYPFGVTNVVRVGLGETVPVTYAIATLSSVLGSAFAMTAVKNLGFTSIILIGLGGYVATAFVYLAAKSRR